ncbi:MULTISPECIES: hypothetical protein [Streptacidiphilus]|uniref:Uncharacterized protein n=1 Tax=Streptacidiphilus cavernicola TaxID=3342716 RepID=A0ABV6URV8_9ACTN|nr:hypothetical protein [Streptacidiphilus jeojiense]
MTRTAARRWEFLGLASVTGLALNSLLAFMTDGWRTGVADLVLVEGIAVALVLHHLRSRRSRTNYAAACSTRNDNDTTVAP